MYQICIEIDFKFITKKGFVVPLKTNLKPSNLFADVI